jgi:hypothetical protein
VNTLLNPDIIKAAASSTLGILSLMCLIIGVISLGLFRNSPVWARLFVFTLLLVGVGGFGAAALRQQAPQTAAAEASREFIVGRWQVEQVVAGGEGGSFVDYGDDGRFTGKQEAFVNGNGVRQPVGGTWHFGKLAKDQFRMDLVFDDGRQWNGTFRILDHEHIHNLGENYVAIRVAR